MVKNQLQKKVESNDELTEEKSKKNLLGMMIQSQLQKKAAINEETIGKTLEETLEEKPKKNLLGMMFQNQLQKKTVNNEETVEEKPKKNLLGLMIQSQLQKKITERSEENNAIDDKSEEPINDPPPISNYKHSNHFNSKNNQKSELSNIQKKKDIKELIKNSLADQVYADDEEEGKKKLVERKGTEGISIGSTSTKVVGKVAEGYVQEVIEKIIEMEEKGKYFK